MRNRPQLEALEPRLLLDGAAEAPVSERIIDFAGMQWVVRADDPAAQGDNWYSDSEQNVWVDADGLHLTLRADAGTWYAAEVTTTQSTTAGMHRFYLTGRPDLFDPNVRLGLSITDGADSIGIELGDSVADGTDNALYSVRPDGGVAKTESFELALNDTQSTHQVLWGADEVQFDSFHWHSTEPITPAHEIHAWQYAGVGVPDDDGQMTIRIGLELNYALPPTDGEAVEIVITTAAVPNHAPTVQAVVASPGWLIAGEQVTLTAAGAADSKGAVVSAEFFHDINGDGIGQASESLGVDADGADRWSWTGPIDWSVGPHSVLVQITDDDSAASGFASGDVVVAAAPTITAVIGTGVGAQGRTLTFTDPDGSKVTMGMKGGLATLRFTSEPMTVSEGQDGLVLAGGVRLVEVSLSGTTLKSWLAVVVGGGDGLLEIGRITSSAPIGRIQGPAVDLVGSGMHMTGDGVAAVTVLHNLRNGADVIMAGDAGNRGIALLAADVSNGSVIDILQGPIRGMKFTGSFAGVLAAGVSPGADALWFTDDDVVVNRVRVGPIRILHPTIGETDMPTGVLLGPLGGNVITPRTPKHLTSSAGVFDTRILPGPDAGVSIIRVKGNRHLMNIAGSVTDVAVGLYKVAVYADIDGVLTLQQTVMANRRGVWVARQIVTGSVHVFLVAQDFDLPQQLADPLAIDGLDVLAADSFDI